MKLHSDPTPGLRITGYGSGFVTVDDERITRSFIVLPDRIVREGVPAAMNDIDPEFVDVLVTIGAEVILLGTGVRQRWPDDDILRELAERGIGLEVMDTAAACRTYNILMADGRIVAAVLFME